MTAYLLDTNHLSPLITLSHPLRQRVLAHQQAGDTFAVATPTITEMVYGIGVLPRSKQNLQQWYKLRPTLNIYRVGLRSAELAAGIQITLRRQGWQLDTVDAIIATIALQNKLVLLTTDKDFQGITTLKRENWL